jgi:hypothetical protein
METNLDNRTLINYAQQQAARVAALAERLEMAVREDKDLQDEIDINFNSTFLEIADDNDN